MDPTATATKYDRGSRRCAFCRKLGDHPECAEAFGLDYDPESQDGARQWLAARRRWVQAVVAGAEIRP